MTVLTFTAELERKTLETAETLALRHEQGVLNDREFRIVMNAIWDCTSGLVDQMTEVMNAVADAGLKDETLQTVVSNGKQVYIVGRNNLTVSVQDAHTFAESNIRVFDIEADAAEHQRKLVKAFISKGFRKL